VINKEDLAEFVREVYATYNQQLLRLDEKPTFRAWYNLLYDLDIEEIRSAFIKLATYEKYMPRPGDVRRAAIDTQTKIPQQLDPYSAWGTFQTIIQNIHSGTQTEIPKPEALVKTMQHFGDSIFTMHTNGDREAFIRVYTKVVDEIEKEKYAFTEPMPAQAPAEKTE
jgi:hypothetical protein